MDTYNSIAFENYIPEVKEKWGKTDAYKQYAEKTANYPKEKWDNFTEEMNGIFARFASCKKDGEAPDSARALDLVKELQNHITENCYLCTDEILAGLGQMYSADERFRNYIDSPDIGTAEYLSKAIGAYCEKN